MTTVERATRTRAASFDRINSARRRATLRPLPPPHRCRPPLPFAPIPISLTSAFASLNSIKQAISVYPRTSNVKVTTYLFSSIFLLLSLTPVVHFSNRIPTLSSTLFPPSTSSRISFSPISLMLTPALGPLGMNEIRKTGHAERASSSEGEGGDEKRDW